MFGVHMFICVRRERALFLTENIYESAFSQVANFLNMLCTPYRLAIFSKT